jgi:hypothetical protein
MRTTERRNEPKWTSAPVLMLATARQGNARAAQHGRGPSQEACARASKTERQRFSTRLPSGERPMNGCEGGTPAQEAGARPRATKLRKRPHKSPTSWAYTRSGATPPRRRRRPTSMEDRAASATTSHTGCCIPSGHCRSRSSARDTVPSTGSSTPSTAAAAEQSQKAWRRGLPRTSRPHAHADGGACGMWLLPSCPTPSTSSLQSVSLWLLYQRRRHTRVRVARKA